MSMGQHQYIPLAKLLPSPLNHRKHFDKAKMEELANSIRAQGVIQPILARPINGDDAFEVVAGERRFRAARMAELVDIPAVVRELTDAQALELQVIENGQRVDVHPLEEAEGYEALMKCRRADGTAYGADEIAAKVGKSRAYVYGRLKLLALGQAGRDAFHEGTLDASRALLLARIPVPELQDKALAEILQPQGFNDEPMSYREAADHVQENYMLQLRIAPFKTDDAELVPAAGACRDCPKRSGNQPELFPDVQSADVCTDPQCFGAKRAAHLEQLRQSAIAKGKEVVAARAKGYVKLDDHCRSDHQYRTYRELLGKDSPKPSLMPEASDATAKLVEVVKKADIAELLEKKKAAPRAPVDYEEERRKRDAERALNLSYRRKLFAHIVAAIPTEPGTRELTLCVESALQLDADHELVDELLLPAAKAKRSPGGSQARLRQVLPQLDQAGLIRLLLALFVSQEVDEWQGNTKLLAEIAEKYGVDIKAVRAAAVAESKAAAKSKAATA